MEPVAISWLIASSSSPLVAVLALWTVYVFHTYRRRWRTVDLFLLAVTSQELVTSIFIFCYAIISLINPPFQVPCNFTQWGLVATRTFQISTLTSMVVDRALTVRWPYRYRFSVRRNQIRYHIAVLALVSILVGVAAIFARLPKDTNNRLCHLHPIQWDTRYVVFLLSLYGVLMLVSLICMVQVEIHRSKHGTKLGANGSFQLPECASPELQSATGMNSPLDTQSSTGSTRALHRPSRQASRRPYGKNAKGTSDLRWPSVALASLLCFSLNHIPHLVLMCMATWSSYLWSPWHEAILAWLRLLEGLLVPVLLFCKDHALRSALRRTFQRRSGALSPLVGDDGPFQMYFDKDHFRKRGTFGSVTPIGIITNYRRTPGKKRRTRKSSGKYTLPGLHNGDSVLPKSCFSASILGTEPLSKLSCADLTSLEMWREEDEENFYATLSDDFSSFSCKSADDSALSEDIRINEELYGGSFTTIANDDFEFHDTRPCGGEVKMKPALTQSPPHTNSFNAGVSRNVSFKENVEKTEEIRKSIPYERGQDLFDFMNHQNEDEDKKDPNIFTLPSNEWIPGNVSTDPSSPETEKTPPRDVKNKFGTMSRCQKTTSYSMNDLDLIHRGSSMGNDLETTFILPVKSESTMSLYRLNVERDLDQLMISPSKSENNVNGDSGFGSGAQSTNPVWSGFLCRKPSDPFWNIRKPSTHATAAVTPTKNYPGILHPRMRKIPWISAWKKLDENSDRNENKNSHLRDNKMGWIDNITYIAKPDPAMSNTRDNHVGTIDEELSDLNSPIFNEDYNLNIFAKESGVLLENAYGKIVRDDCGVKVNFYGPNVQYDSKDDDYGNTENLLENRYDKPTCNTNENLGGNFTNSSRKIENIYQPLNAMAHEDSVGLDLDGNCTNHVQSQAVESTIGGDYSSDLYKCELRLNGGHYENLFGTKENIFAQCEDYKDRSKPGSVAENSKLERRGSERRESGRLKKNTHLVFQAEVDSVYGQLKKVKRKESLVRKKEELPELHTKELRRKESADNRSNKCDIKRKESKSRNDKQTDACWSKDTSESTYFGGDLGSSNVKSIPPKIEIEMKNVPNKNDLNLDNRFTKNEISDEIRCSLLRRESQNRRIRENNTDASQSKHDGLSRRGSAAQEHDKRAKLDRKESREKDRLYNRERKFNVERKDSGREVYSDNKDGLWQRKVDSKEIGKSVNVERKESGKRDRKDSSCQVNVERKDSGRKEFGRFEQRYGLHRRDSQIKKNSDVKNEGLWVNATPFHVQPPNGIKDELNGNAIRRDGRKDAFDMHRSPRKSNLIRKESKNRNDKPGEYQVKRKVSANRGKKEQDVGGSKIPRREFSNLPKSDSKWTQPQQNDINFDDFAKYREKCEDNFSHIQNLNRETSAERENSRMGQVLTYGKLNGNVSHNDEVYPFDTFQEQRRAQFTPNPKPVYDINENCRQKKLAITDFL